MLGLKEIKERYRAACVDELPEFVSMFGLDERSGVKKLVSTADKKIKAFEQEKQRIENMLYYEREYEAYGAICGVDEAGRGPLAGPVAAGAVILPKNCRIYYLNDSKQLSEKQREELYEIIQEKAVSWAVAMISPERIDEINILQATYEAMRKAIDNLKVTPDILLNDAVTIPNLEAIGLSIPQVPIIKGDGKSLSIAAASVMAKVTRDRLMMAYDERYPEYGFRDHKGYGSSKHIEALRQYGPSPIHRRSFLTNILGQKN
jgi:ribonuclease HII